jgi:hypothetical protein
VLIQIVNLLFSRNARSIRAQCSSRGVLSPLMMSLE